MASSITPGIAEPADELVALRAFPQFARLKSLPSDRARELYARAMNNPRAFWLTNRRYLQGVTTCPPPELSAAGLRVAADLAANGIAFAHWSEFFPERFFSKISDRFYRYLDKFERNPRPGAGGGKGVFLDTVHKAHTFVTDDAVSMYLGDPGIAAVAARYMGMVPRFVGSSFWRTRPATGSDRLYSQLWHRDYNDRMLMKLFLYVTDVSETEGYFEYLAGSHESGVLGAEFDRIGPDGFRAYPDATAVERCVAGVPTFDLDKVAAEQRSGASAPWAGIPAVIRCIAPKATLIFADTYGVHRGGYVHAGHRDMIMTTYSTNFNVHKPHFAVTRGYADTLSPFMRMAFGVA
jgi:hypothetical protein